ncbi:DNA/RNA helicase domain-containing protein [uncultured Methanobrevibacter sp.]|uniref:DNA/RNA helicase domain-containing protein n=1 Tax=uncultured Methanobrevibacter sp. TaxID=253161 RepID=UPI0026160A3F|nr:DNA/RNA helicase domain-containing protein [uncultured Methanobrevibacter sp.]
MESSEIRTWKSQKIERCCYADLIANFSNVKEEEFINQLQTVFLESYSLDLSDEQVHAWRDAFRVMQAINLNSNINIIFEYVLPYESGRRPDIILLSKEDVIVLEFKMKNKIKQEDIDQVAAYARDLREYHYESRDKNVIPILVLTGTNNLDKKIDNVQCVSDDMLQRVLDRIYSGGVNICDIKKWVSSKYEPLPTIVDAARRIMDEKELPNLRRVNSACIPQTLENLKYLTSYARDNKKHVIAFVTGVPGAGKTYLGLQYVYDVNDVNSIYLSGNGPLVEVLTDALKSDVFAKEIRNIVDEFCSTGALDFNKNVIVFDEGQRAWDDKRMLKKGINYSEAEIMVKLCEERLEWCVLLILIGEGQEIHTGENSGLILWNNSINKGNKNWDVACPPKLTAIFKDQFLINTIDNESFDLTVSLRSHLSGNVSRFINYLIDGDIENAADLSKSILAEGYDMYCTRELEAAKSYCENRYKNEPNKKYGLIASSKARGLFKYEINNAPDITRKIDNGKWFNAPSTDSKSCCALKDTVTEFNIQGLELDMPIIVWGIDMLWNGKEWLKFKPHQDKNSDANTYRRNSYRVLLTRGRDGFIIFVPPKPKKLDLVYDLLINVGIKEL